MKIVIAIDSFKGSLSSMEAGNAAGIGIQKADPSAVIDVCPMADGGEGTVEALIRGLNGNMHRIKVTGPLGQPVFCQYGILPDGKTAVMEMAQAAGITLLKEEERNPMETTTYGVGEAICHAMEQGCRRFLIGIGGSATNDGGAGMLQALGYDLLDSEGSPIPKGAKGLALLKTISNAKVHPLLKECRFQIACDVTNPLCGKQGASAVFGPQKGADASMVKQLDQLLDQYARIAVQSGFPSDPDYPGAGAAGGLGFAFLTFTNASLESGIQMVIRETGLEDRIRTADLVVTGEGRLDGQTAMGKAPQGVARLAKKYDKPVIAFAGSVTEDAHICNENGIDGYFSILPGIMSLSEAMNPQTAAGNLAQTAEQVYRVFRLYPGKVKMN